jgi:hypothetical protein
MADTQHQYDVSFSTPQLELQAEQVARSIRFNKTQIEVLNRQVQYDTDHLIAIHSELALREKDTR